jgi:hypothetical protein
MWTNLRINVDIDRLPPDWNKRPTEGQLVDIVGIPDGTQGGNPAVGLRIQMPDGSYVFTQTTWALFHAATAALRGRYGEPGLGL